MELKTNSKCQLIVDGLPNKKEGFKTLELIIHDIDWKHYAVIEDRKTEHFIYDMQKDGLYSYYVIYWEIEKEIPLNLPVYLFDAKNHSIDYTLELQLFSICKLRNCVLALEKEAINDFISSVYTKKKCEKNSNNYLKDYLLISIFVLENLICQEKYSEATMILDALETCGGLCNTVKINNCKCNESNF